MRAFHHFGLLGAIAVAVALLGNGGPTCVPIPVACQEGDACDDFDLCTVDDICLPDGACEGVPVECPGDEPCASGVCDPNTGGCGIVYNDGELCYGDGPCDFGTCSGGMCALDPPLNCDDDNPCTMDSCDPITRDCVHTPLPCPGGPVINEIDYDQPGTDSMEFIEIFNPGPDPFLLDTAMLELVNGNGEVVYRTVELALAGPALLPGQFLVYGPLAVVAGLPGDTLVMASDLDTNIIQNGTPDGVVLWDQFGILDSVAYEGPMQAAGEGSPAPADPNDVEASLVRCPDGFDTDDNGADFWLAPLPTPGVPNLCDLP